MAGFVKTKKATLRRYWWRGRRKRTQTSRRSSFLFSYHNPRKYNVATSSSRSKRDEDEDKLQNLLLSDLGDLPLPLSPPSTSQVNFVSYFITGSQIQKNPFWQSDYLFNFFLGFRFYEIGSWSIYLHANGYDKYCSFSISSLWKLLNWYSFLCVLFC